MSQPSESDLTDAYTYANDRRDVEKAKIIIQALCIRYTLHQKWGNYIIINEIVSHLGLGLASYTAPVETNEC